MIAVDINVLVYTHRADSAFHARAYAAVRTAAEGMSPWAIPWPCVHEFLAIVTHPKIFEPPSTLAEAIDQMEAWLASPTLRLLCEAGDHWSQLTDALERSLANGPRVHDARIAALCRSHAIRELWTVDRDFHVRKRIVDRAVDPLLPDRAVNASLRSDLRALPP